MNAIEAQMMIDAILEMMVDPETGEVVSEDEALKLAETYEAQVLDKCEWMLKHITTEKYKIEAMENQKKTLDKMIKNVDEVVSAKEKDIMTV